jgi:hypothetical protein
LNWVYLEVSAHVRATKEQANEIGMAALNLMATAGVDAADLRVRAMSSEKADTDWKRSALAPVMIGWMLEHVLSPNASFACPEPVRKAAEDILREAGALP